MAREKKRIKPTSVEDLLQCSVKMAMRFKNGSRHYGNFLVKNAQSLLDSEPNQKDEFEAIFSPLTDHFCDLIGYEEIQYNTINRILDIWLKMIMRIDESIKLAIFMEQYDNLKCCINFIKRVGCFSMQRKMLCILFGYIKTHGNNEESRLLAELFKPIERKTSELQRDLFDRFDPKSSNDVLDDQRRFLILLHFNQSLQSKILSQTIHRMYFDDELAGGLYPAHDSWLDFNLGSKDIEFYFWHKRKLVMAKIDTFSIHWLRYEGSDEYTRHINIELINPLELQALNDATQSEDLSLREIHFVMSHGFLTSELEEFLAEMFPEQYECSKKAMKYELNEDDDIGIIEEDVEVSYRDIVERTSSTKIDDETLETGSFVDSNLTWEKLDQSKELKTVSGDSTDDEEASQIITVQAQIHCDINGNVQSRETAIRIPKKKFELKKSVRKQNIDEIASIPFDMNHFERKVKPRLLPELQVNEMSTSRELVPRTHGESKSTFKPKESLKEPCGLGSKVPSKRVVSPITKQKTTRKRKYVPLTEVPQPRSPFIRGKRKKNDAVIVEESCPDIGLVDVTNFDIKKKQNDNSIEAVALKSTKDNHTNFLENLQKVNNTANGAFEQLLESPFYHNGKLLDRKPTFSYRQYSKGK